MNVKPFFKKYSISTTSVHLAIRDVGFIIDEARDPHITSNKLTVELGGHPSSNAIDAGIVARDMWITCLINNKSNITNCKMNRCCAY